ncbi:MAG: YibE/F family protein [Trueperaceae bacterium]
MRYFCAGSSLFKFSTVVLSAGARGYTFDKLKTSSPLFCLLICIFFSFSYSQTTGAPEIVYLEGRITYINPNTSVADIKLRKTGGTVNARMPDYDIVPNAPIFKVGDVVEVAQISDGNGGNTYEILEWVRRPVLGWLLGLFVVVTLFVARLKGLRAILATALSLAIVTLYIVPQILAGTSPILVSLIGAGGILILAIFFVHGINWSTTAALFGTLVTIGLTLTLGQLFIHIAQLTGFGTEEAMYFNIAAEQINLRGLTLAGLLIGSLGALTDTSVVQASLVRELAHVNPRLGARELYKRGMRVGRDHIGSLVNTLVFAYAGSALPMLLLLIVNEFSLAHSLNMELIATQVVHTLVGSVGLVWAVPLTTSIAALLFRGDKLAMQQGEHAHPGFSQREEQLSFQRSRQLEMVSPVSREEAIEELLRRNKDVS